MYVDIYIVQKTPGKQAAYSNARFLLTNAKGVGVGRRTSRKVFHVYLDVLDGSTPSPGFSKEMQLDANIGG